MDEDDSPPEREVGLDEQASFQVAEDAPTSDATSITSDPTTDPPSDADTPPLAASDGAAADVVVSDMDMPALGGVDSDATEPDDADSSGLRIPPTVTDRDAPEPMAGAAALASATTAVGLPAVRPDGRARPRGAGRTRGVFAALDTVAHATAASGRNTRLLIFTLALLVAVLGSTGLVSFAFPGRVGIAPLSLSSASLTASPRPTPSQPRPATHVPNTDPTEPPDQRPPRPPLSPQGCVSGIAPQPAQGPLGPIYTTHGYAGIGNEIVLTFDDGPNPVFTPQILDELNAANVHATFFVVGHHAQQYPDLVHDEWASGDAIGNHTFSHEWIPGLSPDRLRASLDTTAQMIRAATGDPCLWLFRAPYGQFIPPVRVPPPANTPLPGTPPAPTPTPMVQVPVQVTQAWKQVYSEGYTSINWDSAGSDWLLPGSQVISQRIIAQLHPGAIILMHDGAPDNEKQDRSQTVAALPAILEAIKARGLQPVTLPRMLVDAGLIKRPSLPTATPTPTKTPLPRVPGDAALFLAPLMLAWRRQSRRACDDAAGAAYPASRVRVCPPAWFSGGSPRRRCAAGRGTG